MADPQDSSRPDGVPADGRARRQPPTIDVEAVEVPLAGAAASAAAAGPDSGPAPAKPKTASRWGTWLAVVGSIGVVVAIVAGAVWIYAIPDRPEAQPQEAVSAETAKLDDLSARLAKLEAVPASTPAAAPAQPAPDPALARRIAVLEAAVTPLTARIAELERQVRDDATVARNAGERADTVAGLVDELKKGAAAPGTLQQHERSALEGLAGRIKELEALEATLKSRQDDFDGAVSAPPPAPDKSVRVAVIAAALRNAVERDYPFTAELNAARALGLDDKTLTALEPFAATGVPSQNELFRDLSALVPQLLRVSAPAGHDGNYLERLGSSAAKMMNIRPAGDVQGDDPATVIGRIDLRMVRQDVTSVVTELDKLPAPAKELAAPWRKKALARQAAIEAARRLASASFAKLGETAAAEPPRR
jgi:hypothetical protein